MSIILSDEQKAALDASAGELVRLIDGRTGVEYVLITAETFSTFQAWFEPMWRAGWGDPEMDVYDNYDENLKKFRGE